MTRSAVIVAKTDAWWVSDRERPARSVRAELVWTVTDPYAVRLVLRGGRPRRVEWYLARELLWAGVRARVGLGDVRVAPAGPGVVEIELSSPSGRAGFEVNRCDLTQFLRATRDHVGFGAETHPGMDAELAYLLDNPNLI